MKTAGVYELFGQPSYLFCWKLLTNIKTWDTSACHAYPYFKNLCILYS